MIAPGKDRIWRAGLGFGAMAWAAAVSLLLIRATPAERPVAIALVALVAPLGTAALGLGFLLFDREPLPRPIRAGGRFACAALIAPMALAVLALGRRREPAA